MYWDIYKLTNSIDGKVYIGLTSRTAAVRFDDHCQYARKILRRGRKNPTTVQRAIRIHGENKFSVEVIDLAETREAAWQKERYWIRMYRSNDRRFGYNRTPGGEGVLRPWQKEKPEDI